MSVIMSNRAKPVPRIQLADVMAPPHAPLAMPKQVLSASSGRFMRAVRSLLWAVAPGLRRLG